MLILLAVFWPYYQVFIPETFLFPIESLYDGLWFLRLTIENQLRFSLSTVDLFSKLIPHLGIYTSLASAATLIRRKDSRRSSSVATADQTYARQVRIQSAKIGLVPDAVATDTQGTPVPVSRASRWKEYVVHLFFFAWGLGLLVFHVRAVTRSHEIVSGCRQVTGFWFATDYPYSVYTYNYYREGTASPNESSWTRLGKETLVYLGISHCPELKVPHALQSFPNLLGVKFHNTTIVEWTKENRTSASKHTKMTVLVIVRTNMSGLSEDMLSPLPPSLMDIELSHTNLTSLPADLHEKWHSMATVYFEHSLMIEFPETLLSLQAIEFSLPRNLIESVSRSQEISTFSRSR